METNHLGRHFVSLRITEARIASLARQCVLAEGAEGLDTAGVLAEIQWLALRYLHGERGFARGADCLAGAFGTVSSTSYRRSKR